MFIFLALIAKQISPLEAETFLLRKYEKFAALFAVDFLFTHAQDMAYKLADILQLYSFTLSIIIVPLETPRLVR